MAAPSYHNTVPEPRVLRGRYEQLAQGQEADILRWALRHPFQSFTREDVEGRFNLTTQSASRALANLTRIGKLEKTGERVLSSHGRTCGTWRLARPAGVGETGRLFA